VKHAAFAFDPDLLELLPGARRRTPLPYSFRGPQSTKHLIEAMGIPHTEVGSILVAGEPRELGYLVCDGDLVQVRGASVMDIPQGEPRFVIDGHLGRLAAGLRMLGFDCLYDSQAGDDQLYDEAMSESRYLLTRDRRLLMRKNLVLGYLVRSLEPLVQLVEVSRRFGVIGWAKPFRRCIRCNHLLEPVEKRAILERLEPLTQAYFTEFRQCTSCKQIYWKGSHFERMQARIAELLGGAGS
jgi:uncharacterized protein with PIN domain